MLDVTYRSSKVKKIIASKMLALLMLSGCSVASINTDEQHLEGIKQTPVSQRNTRSENKHYARHETNSSTSANGARLGKNQHPKLDKIVTAAINTPAKNSVRNFDIDLDRVSTVQQSSNSAACRYFKNTADAEAVITASPTLSASTDEDGSGSVSLGMNILDIKKSKLLRASGEAKCRLHEASKKIEATVGLGTELTAYASAKAKETYIRKNSSKLKGLSSKADSLVQQGAMNRQDANLIKYQIAELKFEMEKSSAQAARRQGLPNLTQEQLKDRHGALFHATTDLQNIERDLRTTEALELSLSGGYRYSDQFNDDLQQRDNPGAYARMNVSVRLGALSSERSRFEDAAASAKFDSLFEEYTGVIWKSGYTQRSINRAIVHLKRSEHQLQIALLQNENTIKNLENSDRHEILRALLQAEIKSVQLGSELAAMRASIKELNTYQQKIKALSN